MILEKLNCYFKKVNLIFLILILGCGEEEKCRITPFYFEGGEKTFPFPADYILRESDGKKYLLIPENFLPRIFKELNIETDGFSPQQSVIFPFEGTFKEGKFFIPPEKSIGESSPVFLMNIITGEPIPFEIEEHRGDAFGIPLKGFSFIRILPLKPYSRGLTYIAGVYKDEEICSCEEFEKELNSPSDEYHSNLKNYIEDLRKRGLLRKKIAIATIFTVKVDESLREFLLKRINSINSPEVFIDEIISCTGPHSPSQHCKDNSLPGKIIHGYVNSLSFIYPYGATGKIKREYLEGEQPEPISVPFILALPSSQPPYNLVIFQHGFGDHKEAMFLELAYKLNMDGFAVGGIDVVFHGERKLPPEISKNAGMPQLDLLGVDLDTGEFDPLAMRDHLIQTLIDQNHLHQALLRFPEISTYPSYYVGQSLGGILGTIFSAVSRNLHAACINVGGGNFIRIMRGYKEIQPLIVFLLGTEEVLTQYLSFELLQLILDPVDPANYISHIVLNPFPGRNPRHLLIQEAIGDLLVANDATEYIARAGGIPLIIPSVTNPPFMENAALPVFHNINSKITAGLYQFSPATHGFLLTITEKEPWREAQDQLSHFFKNEEIQEAR